MVGNAEMDLATRKKDDELRELIQDLLTALKGKDEHQIFDNPTFTKSSEGWIKPTSEEK